MISDGNTGWNTLGPHSPPAVRGGSELDTDGFPEVYKRVEAHFLVSSAAVQLTPALLSYFPNFRPGAAVIFPPTTVHIVMFLSTALTFLAVGALSANALTVPVARSPAPEPECEFPRSSSITSYHDLTFVSFSRPSTRGLDAQARPFIRPVLT